MSYFKEIFEKIIQEIICKHSEDNQLREALLYATTNGGKRTRPILCWLFYSLFASPSKQELSTDTVTVSDILYPAIAIELIHCYSLVHDDLPAMDNDQLRRGQPTTHIKYSESTAILVGDALQAMAFSILSDHDWHIESSVKLKLIQILSKASGACGMVNGQFLDMLMTASDHQIEINHIQKMHDQKTGALIQASCLMGAITTQNISDDDIKKISDIGLLLGSIFQLQDDILDITQPTHVLGKTAGKDTKDFKPSLVSAIGLEAGRDLIQARYTKLDNLLEKLPTRSEVLREFIDTLMKRSF